MYWFFLFCFQVDKLSKKHSKHQLYADLMRLADSFSILKPHQILPANIVNQSKCLLTITQISRRLM